MALARSKLPLGTLVVAAAFLAGSVPLYLKDGRLTEKVSVLQTRLGQAGHQLTIATPRNQLGMILIEVEQNNFGLTRERSTHFFDGLRQVIRDQTDPQLRELIASAERRYNLRSNISDS